MLRYQSAVTVGLGLVFALPLGALQGPEFVESLRLELARTESALSVLESYADQAAQGAPVSIDRLRSITEPQTTPPDLADMRLEALQIEVRELSVQLDGLRTRRDPSHALASQRAVSAEGTRRDVVSIAPTVGLDVNQLRTRSLASQELATSRPSARLGSESVPNAATAREPRVTKNRGALPAQPVSAARGTPEAILAQARALYRSGDQALALERFRQVEQLPESRYWIGRCLEQLGRTDEALLQYEALAEQEQVGEHAERASEAASFLRWKRSLDANSKASTGGRP